MKFEMFSVTTPCSTCTSSEMPCTGNSGSSCTSGAPAVREEVSSYLSLPQLAEAAQGLGFGRDAFALIGNIIEAEWADFDAVQGQNGRATCQDDARRFVVYRLSQYLAFPPEALSGIYADMVRAQALGRNVIADKYARMMRTTDPELFWRDLASQIEDVTPLKKRVLDQLKSQLNTFESAAATELVAAHANSRPDSSSAGKVSSVDYYLAEAEGYSLQTLRLLLDGFAAQEQQGTNPVALNWELAVMLDQLLDQAQGGRA